MFFSNAALHLSFVKNCILVVCKMMKLSDVIVRLIQAIFMILAQQIIYYIFHKTLKSHRFEKGDMWM